MIFDYILNSTLFTHQLVQLSKLELEAPEGRLRAGGTVDVKLRLTDRSEHFFSECHIDNTMNRRLRLPAEAMLLLKNEFPFSAAYLSDQKAASIWKKEDVKEFYRRRGKGEPLDEPVETLHISWEEPYLVMEPGFRITLENAAQVLTAGAMSRILPYIFTSVSNTIQAEPTAEGKKCYIIDGATPWLPVSQYRSTAFAHPGIYIMRRRDEAGQYHYYVGKASDIKNRIIASQDKLCHPDEKCEENRQYDDICCVSIDFDAFRKTYQMPLQTQANNPGVPRGSEVDHMLYAVEDVAIHAVAMVLCSEGRELDNRQYRYYTTGAVNRSRQLFQDI